ncbi:MAG: hypothetical protein OEZ33_03450 [Gammaproteobacteria bacterium]|nr:hypothetical protein [Gammaproteobacteria bacterium]MDH5777243.1 hypothetical protein [Gammaproteobacteria bacterium]
MFRTVRITSVLFFYFSIHSLVYAGEVLHSFVDHEDDHFFLQLEMRVNAQLDSVRTVLLDFNKLTKVNNNIIYSRLLESTGQQHKAMVITEGCIWFFCKTLKQVQTIKELPNGYLLVETLPKQSDLEFGNILWHVRAEGKKTLISYSADFIPGFWVPPLIGPWLMNNRLLAEGKETINGIEREAKRRAGQNL